MNRWHRWNRWSFVFYYEDESLSKACSKLLILKGNRLYHFKLHVELSDASILTIVMRVYKKVKILGYLK